MTEPKKFGCFDPFIKATFEIRGPLFVVLVVQNVSKMGAVDVKLEISLVPGDFKKSVLFPLMMPRQKVRFILPDGNIKVLAEKFTTLTLKGECRDVSGKNITKDDAIDLRGVLKSWIESSILVEETVTNRLSQVADRIERLERSVERMLSMTGGGVLIKTREDELKEFEEMKRRYEARENKEEKPSETS